MLFRFISIDRMKRCFCLSTQFPAKEKLEDVQVPTELNYMTSMIAVQHSLLHKVEGRFFVLDT